MIVLEPFSVFSKQRSGATGKDRVMRHVGGYVIAEYEYAYEKLTGEKLALAPDGSSYVTHQMVFERQIAVRTARFPNPASLFAHTHTRREHYLCPYKTVRPNYSDCLLIHTTKD